MSSDPPSRPGLRPLRRSRVWPGQLASYAVTVFALVTLRVRAARAMPGDPLSAQLSGESGAYLQNPEVRAAQAAYNGLDQPLIVQYGRYLRDLAGGDLGTSILYGGMTLNRAQFEPQLFLNPTWTWWVLPPALAIFLAVFGFASSAWASSPS